MRALLLSLTFLAALTGRADAILCTPILGCDCTVTASDISFGSFTPSSGTQDAVGEIEIECSGVIDVAPSVLTQLDDGQWGSFATRKMRLSAGEFLDYNIYTTTQRTTVWGDGTGGSSTVMVSGGLVTLGNWSVTRDMFARASPTSTVKPGAYTDTVVVRIVW